MAEADVPVYDVVVVGAGLSGINAAYRLQTTAPELNFTIIESRQVIGGTWAFWQYPGVRSDSDVGMFALPWHPWPHDVAIAPAHLLREYLEDAARMHGIDKKVQLGHRLVAASWSSKEQLWTIDIEVTASPSDGNADDQLAQVNGYASQPTRKRLKTWFIINCAGYYDYEQSLKTIIPGIDDFQGQVLHPQFWPKDVKLAGKRIVLIGSGATAVTMLPSLADADVEKVTMLQRSPSYILPIPKDTDAVTAFCRKLPWWLAWRSVFLWHTMVEILVVSLLTLPGFGRWLLRRINKSVLPKDVDVDKHFKPRYEPFQQRLCFSPDADFFKALGKENCEIVTDEIETVTADAIRTKGGMVIPADIIVTATGLHMRVFGKYEVTVDGQPLTVEMVNERFIWNSITVEGMPNMGTITSYTIGTWTPGSTARIELVIKIMKMMRREGWGMMAPEIVGADVKRAMKVIPAVPQTSTYVMNAWKRLPLQTGKGPWINRQSWLADWLFLQFGDLKKGLELTPKVGGEGTDGRSNGKVKVS